VTGITAPFRPDEATDRRSLPDAPGSVDARRQLGAYYTPQTATDYMADWVVRRENEHYLEPSLGDGAFLRAVEACAERKMIRHLRLSGIEIDRSTLRQIAAVNSLPVADLRLGDFLESQPFQVQAVIGNPPYVRLRALTEKARASALEAASQVLGTNMDPSGSIWMPFVLHATRFLVRGGRLAFVLPYELTYVRYARPLWQWLGARFGKLQVLRTHERLFPDILQDVVILLADNYNSATEQITYKAFQNVDDLNAARPVAEAKVSIGDLLVGKRPFKHALLSPALRQLLEDKVSGQVVPARKLATFNIGYVSGDKTFFHPSEGVASEFNLPARSLAKTMTSARRMRDSGLRTSDLPDRATDQLFLPNPSALTKGEKRYVHLGDKQGVSKRYKCRVREPWFLVPGARVPDLLLSVFTERPVLRVNDGRYLASNSLLCAYLKNATADELVSRWYTSLTLLMCELEVHSLGGGVMILVPREAGNVLLPASTVPSAGHIRVIDQSLRGGRTDEAYASGDFPILTQQLGLSAAEVELIREGIRTLTYWRTSSRTSTSTTSLENLPEQCPRVEPSDNTVDDSSY
jgi:adenine-specific DNA-methyltransferase